MRLSPAGNVRGFEILNRNRSGFFRSPYRIACCDLWTSFSRDARRQIVEINARGEKRTFPRTTCESQSNREESRAQRTRNASTIAGHARTDSLTYLHHSLTASHTRDACLAQFATTLASSKRGCMDNTLTCTITRDIATRVPSFPPFSRPMHNTADRVCVCVLACVVGRARARVSLSQ